MITPTDEQVPARTAVEGLQELISDLGRWDRMQSSLTKQHKEGADMVKEVVAKRLEPILAALLPSQPSAKHPSFLAEPDASEHVR